MATIATITRIAAAAAFLSLGGHPAASAAEDPSPTSRVYVVQGVPAVSVDVTVDGDSVGKRVASEAILGPVEMSPGRHTITFTSRDWTVSSSFEVTRRSMDVVLHWPADVTRKPEVTVFNNDLQPVAAGKGRLTIAHTAVVPPADVRVEGKVLFANIANGQFVSADVPATTYSVDIVPTGESGNPLLGPLALAVKPGALTRVFAIGEPRNGSMDAVVQVLTLAEEGSPAPGEVDAGSAGLVSPPVADPAGPPTGVQAAIAVGATVGIGLFLALARRRVRS